MDSINAGDCAASQFLLRRQPRARAKDLYDPSGAIDWLPAIFWFQHPGAELGVDACSCILLFA
jgi:hypothetical protein